jgi:hypothetical protein
LLDEREVLRARGMSILMTSMGWAILMVGLALAGDVAWTAYREWRMRRDAEKNGTTLTTKYGLPH